MNLEEAKLLPLKLVCMKRPIREEWGSDMWNSFKTELSEEQWPLCCHSPINRHVTLELCSSLPAPPSPHSMETELNGDLGFETPDSAKAG
jgi:hypothetical protein